MRSRLIKALNNRFYVKFMQLEIGLLTMIEVAECLPQVMIQCLAKPSIAQSLKANSNGISMTFRSSKALLTNQG